MKEICLFVVETFVYVCTVVNNALDAFAFLYTVHCFKQMLFLSASLITFWPVICETVLLFATLDWLGLDFTFFFFFLLIKEMDRIKHKLRNSNKRHMGGMMLENTYCTSVYFEELRGHARCFRFVNVLLLYIVHSSKKQPCYVTSCCISALSIDISCDVKNHQRSFISSFQRAEFSMRKVLFFFLKIIDVCVVSLLIFLSPCFIFIVS